MDYDLIKITLAAGYSINIHPSDIGFILCGMDMQARITFHETTGTILDLDESYIEFRKRLSQFL